MQTNNTTTTLETGSLTPAQIEANDINVSYWAALSKLQATISKSVEFVQACAYSGGLLAKKKAEVGHGNWLAWLTEHCPEIGEVTARRLMRMHEMVESNRSGGNDLGAVSSIREAYELLLLDEKGSGKSSPSPSKNTPSPSKLQAALSRFWGAIRNRPPEKWEKEEKSEFLIDLAERERLRRKQGWELPSIEIEAEVIK